MAQSIAVAYLGSGSDDTSLSDRLFLIDQRISPDENRLLERKAVNQDKVQIYAVADDSDALGCAAETVLAVLDRHRLKAQNTESPFDDHWIRLFIETCEHTLARLLEPRRSVAAGVSLALLILDQETARLVTIGSARIFLYRNQTMIPLPEKRSDPEKHRLGLLRERTLPGLRDMMHVETQVGDVFLLATDGVTSAVPSDRLATLLAHPGAFIRDMRRLRDAVLERSDASDGFSLIGVRVVDRSTRDDLSSLKTRKKAIRQNVRHYEALSHPFSRAEDALRQDLAARHWLIPLFAGLLTLLLLFLLVRLIWPGLFNFWG